MSDIRKRTGKTGTTYQVRYPNMATKSGYAYKTFDTLKEARAFREDAKARLNAAGQSSHAMTVAEAADRWLEICEMVGRDGREPVEPQTLREYRRRAAIMKEYSWQKPLNQMSDTDAVHFRNWLLKNKSRDLARRTLSSFHSVVVTSRKVIWLFLEQLRFQLVPVLHCLQGRLAAQG